MPFGKGLPHIFATLAPDEPSADAGAVPIGASSVNDQISVIA
jgi:hypothetical protein